MDTTFIKTNWMPKEELIKKHPISTTILKVGDFERNLANYELHAGRKIHQWTEQDWSFICMHVDLSEDFILKYKDKVHWNLLLKYKQLSHNTLVLLIGHDFKDDGLKELYIQQMRNSAKRNIKE